MQVSNYPLRNNLLNFWGGDWFYDIYTTLRNDVNEDGDNFIFIYLVQLGCYPVEVVILHVNKIWNLLLLDLIREGYIRSM